MRYFKAIDGDIPTLASTSDLDGIVCLGSIKSAYENEPWMLKLCDFFRAAGDTKLKVVGTCFGHQLINLAFGGTVTKIAGNRFIFGADQIRINIPTDLEESAISRLLKDGSTLKMLQSHGDEVTSLGAYARLLASSDRGANEIVLVRDNILTMQCHPDLTPHLMMTKIWPSLTEKGVFDAEDTAKVKEEMTKLDTDKCLDIIRQFMLG